jgi:uncharacterized protein YyaL (SSP411 family)
MAERKDERKPNRLIHEKSPYLLQHAYNPVDWYPWGQEAFEKAKREDKPVFLSIGYSTCHWCHVMERESFEDEEVAVLLNQYYVPVKVDREERPDVDHIYMTVCQALTGQGGWPLTVILTPGRKPFFAGTYFPKESRHGRPGLLQILQQVAQMWREERDRIVASGEKIAEAVQPRFATAVRGELTEAVLERAVGQLAAQFDEVYGGFGPAPKFPRPHDLSFLLREWKRTGNEQALRMVEKTLQSMRRGGIYDQIGFGFSRYSTDQEWRVPHFEKMLYDNALLAIAYLEAFQATGNRNYADTVEEIITYVLRDMTSPEGAFYTAEDADSEGVEGKFYVWTPDEVKEILGVEEGERVCRFLGIVPRGNFDRGASIPHRIQTDIESFAAAIGMEPEEWKQRFEAARQKLFAVRERRIRPFRDDKILTGWNGLMIAALAKASAVLERPDYRVAAERAVHFLLTRLRREDGRLLARYRDGEAAHLGYLDDYAFLVWALLELYEASLSPEWLRQAIEWNCQMDALFWDDAEGGLYFYGKDGEPLLARPKEIYDGALPSGNSVAAVNTFRLARLTGDPKWDDKAERQLRTFAGQVEQYPMGYTHFLMAWQHALGPTREIVIVGPRDQEDVREMIRLVHRAFLPDAVVLQYDPETVQELETIAPFVKGMKTLRGRATAYVCRHFSCDAPTDDREEFRRKLGI